MIQKGGNNETFQTTYSLLFSFYSYTFSCFPSQCCTANAEDAGNAASRDRTKRFPQNTSIDKDQN
jgi:hypothetical protein